MTDLSRSHGAADAWRGSVHLSAGRLTYVGQMGGAHRHRHAAVQVMLCTTRSMRWSDASGADRSCRAVVIPPGADHEISGSAEGVMMFIDAAGRLGQLCTERVRQSGLPTDSVHAWAAAADPLLNFATSTSPPSQVAESISVALSGPDDGAPHALHPGLAHAVKLLPDLLDDPVTITRVAAAVNLSASRLGHLFSEELGLPFRAFVRWARLQVAMEQARAGLTLTDAAHAAGFSDSAHLTRVCHEMFGLTPSELTGSIQWQ